MKSYYGIIRQFAKNMILHTRYKIRSILQPSEVILNGILLEIDEIFSTWIRDIVYRAEYEESEAKIIIKKIEPKDIVMEFGAGIGYLSALSSTIIGSERVFSYEANPELIPLIKKTHKNNYVAPQVTNALVSNLNGTKFIYLEEHFFSSSIIKRSQNARKIEVKSLNINDEISRIGATFLIIDIEGGEVELIPHIDFSNIQKILIELHSWIVDAESIRNVQALLTKQGFMVDVSISTEHVLYLEKV